MTQFSILLAALLHDAHHDGLPHHGDDGAIKKHSIDVAFAILMNPKYRELRQTIYKDEAEMRRFRQILVNAIMASNVTDEKLKDLRHKKWREAFEKQVTYSSILKHNPTVENNRKATIGIETLIQASDIMHTMQPWRVYQ